LPPFDSPALRQIGSRARCRPWLFFRFATSCSGLVSGSRRRSLRGPSVSVPFAVRPSSGADSAPANNPSDTLSRETSAFRLSTPPGPPLPPSRQRWRLLRSKVPSADECVPHSGRLRGHERESARHPGAALPPPLGFHRSLFAFASRFRVRLRPTPCAVVPAPGYPFRPTEPTFRSFLPRRGVERSSSTSAIDSSDPRTQPPNRPIPADSISKYRCRLFAGRPDSSSCEGEPSLISRTPSPGCCYRFRGRSRRFRAVPSGVVALRALSRVRRGNSMTTPRSMFAHTSRRRARGEYRSWRLPS
jgi:hypothetical protein